MARKVLIHNLCEPLGGATSAMIDVSTGTGNLTIDRLAGDDRLLATGTLQYMEDQDAPRPAVNTRDGQVILTLDAKGGRQPGFRLPWQACNAATDWQIHLSPAVASEISARTGGGNVRLDLSGMSVTRILADSGGGNMDVILPDNAVDLGVTARSGGGNVTVEIGFNTKGAATVNATSGAGNVLLRLPGGLPARIHATTGMGRVIVNESFGQVERETYQSPDYEAATDKVDVTLRSGAGNVTVETK